MKVLEITGEPILYGGQEKFIANLIERMDDPGIKMDVFAFYTCENDAFRMLLQERGGTLYEQNFDFQPGKSRKFMLHELRSFLNENEYDAIHVHSGSISVLAYCAKAAKEAGVKKRIVHSHCESSPSLKHKMVQLVFGEVIRRNATDFLACSYVAGNDKFPKPIVDNEMKIISNGIDLKQFEKNYQKRKNTRDMLKIEDGTLVIGTVGRFSYQKNTEYAIEVFAAAKDKLKKSKLLLVGDGEFRDVLTSKVGELGLDNDVIFTGNVDNVQDYYQAMDMFVLPSRFEGLPFVALEAQAADLPCIISDGVTKEAIICNDVIQLSLDEKKEWIKAIVEIGTSEKKPANNAKELKAAGFDINNTIEEVKAVYEGNVH